MTEPIRPDDVQPNAPPTEPERRRVRASNDRDQQLEREGHASAHNRGYDDTAHGAPAPSDANAEGPDVDPDSARATNDRDDTVDEP